MIGGILYGLGAALGWGVSDFLRREPCEHSA